MDNIWLIAAFWMGLALVASLISIRVGFSVALVEIAVGVVAGNYLGLQTTPWVDFLASFGAILLTFLAGAEIDPESFRRNLKPSLAIGGVGFLFPFLGALAFAYFVAGWDLHAAEIAGIALSTTSVAVVYAVMVETGLNRTDFGKLILAACFVNDLGTVLALGLLFANFNVWLLVFIAITAVALTQVSRLTRFVLGHWGGRVGARGQVHFLGSLCTRRPRQPRQLRGGASGIPHRPRDRRGLRDRPRARPADPFDRVRAADPALLPEGRALRLASSRGRGLRADRRPAQHQGRDQGDWRLANDPLLRTERARDELHDDDDVDGPDVRDDLGALRAHQPHHQPVPVQRARDGASSSGVRADARSRRPSSCPTSTWRLPVEQARKWRLVGRRARGGFPSQVSR